MSINMLSVPDLFLSVYLAAINLTGFFCFRSDKQRARRRRRRIPERILFLTAILGGGAGCLLAMYFFHHKTRHFRFLTLIPLLTALWAGLSWYLYTRF